MNNETWANTKGIQSTLLNYMNKFIMQSIANDFYAHIKFFSFKFLFARKGIIKPEEFVQYV